MTTPATSTPVKGVGGMPAPGTKRAPEFHRKDPEELKDFLEEYEELADRNGLTEKEKAKEIVKYADKETRAFWKRLPGYGKDYMELKEKILKANSKNTIDDKPVLSELVKLVKKSAKGSLEDKDDLNTYFRKFWIIAADLVEAKVINERQQEEYFWKGIP
jgi:hypothetical protein